MNIHPTFSISLNGKTLDHTDREILPVNEDWVRIVIEFVNSWSSADREVEVQTSGSTGKPKNIAFTKDQMVSSALATSMKFKLKSKDVALLCLPMHSIAGKMMVVRAMVIGMKLILVKPSANPLSTLSNEDLPIHFCPMTPMQVYDTIADKNTADLLKKIDIVIIGGGKVNEDLQHSLSKFPNEIYATFGMTETLTHVAVQKLNDSNSIDSFEALEGISFKTDDRNCLMVHVPYISKDPIQTNDIVELSGTTSFRWVGRYDNIINSGGLKLNPEELESKLAGVIKRPYYFTSRNDDQLGDKLVLMINGDREEHDLNQLINDLMQTLEKHEFPKEINFLDNFEYTTGGKIIRKKL